MSYYQQPVYGGYGGQQPPVPGYGAGGPSQNGYASAPSYGGGDYQQPYQPQPQPPYESKKPNGGGGGNGYTGSASNLFPESPIYHDKWASILYGVNLLVFFGLGGYCISNGGPMLSAIFGSAGGSGSGSGSSGGKVPEGEPAKVFGATIAISIVYAAVYLGLMMYFTRMLIVLTFWLQAGLLIAYGIYVGLVMKQWQAAIIPLLIGAIYGILWFYWRHKVPFATIMLQSVIEVLREYPAMLFTVLGSVIVGAGILAFWAYSLLTAYALYRDPKDGNPKGPFYGFSLFFLFSFYWSNQVIKNVTHTTLCGVYASYYFLEGSGQNIVSPTKSSFKRAITYSFGSICYGSLIIAVIQFLRHLTNNARREREFNFFTFVLLCIACLLSCIQDILEYMNHYAFAQVAIYGKDFCSAAKDTWNLFKSRGLDMVINDNLIGNVLGLGIFFGAVIGALTGYGLSDKESALLYAYIVAGFFIGFFFIWIITEVVSSGVATVFVCLAQDPAALQRTKPELYEKFRSTYPQVTWTV